jgi:hypothetical protein
VKRVLRISLFLISSIPAHRLRSRIDWCLVNIAVILSAIIPVVTLHGSKSS